MRTFWVHFLLFAAAACVAPQARAAAGQGCFGAPGKDVSWDWIKPATSSLRVRGGEESEALAQALLYMYQREYDHQSGSYAKLRTAAGRGRTKATQEARENCKKVAIEILHLARHFNDLLDNPKIRSEHRKAYRECAEILRTLKFGVNPNVLPPPSDPRHAFLRDRAERERASRNQFEKFISYPSNSIGAAYAALHVPGVPEIHVTTEVLKLRSRQFGSNSSNRACEIDIVGWAYGANKSAHAVLCEVKQKRHPLESPDAAYSTGTLVGLGTLIRKSRLAASTSICWIVPNGVTDKARAAILAKCPDATIAAEGLPMPWPTQ